MKQLKSEQKTIKIKSDASAMRQLLFFTVALLAAHLLLRQLLKLWVAPSRFSLWAESDFLRNNEQWVQAALILFGVFIYNKWQKRPFYLFEWGRSFSTALRLQSERLFVPLRIGFLLSFVLVAAAVLAGIQELSLAIRDMQSVSILFLPFLTRIFLFTLWIVSLSFLKDFLRENFLPHLEKQTFVFYVVLISLEAYFFTCVFVDFSIYLKLSLMGLLGFLFFSSYGEFLLHGRDSHLGPKSGHREICFRLGFFLSFFFIFGERLILFRVPSIMHAQKLQEFWLGADLYQLGLFFQKHSLLLIVLFSLWMLYRGWRRKAA